MLFALVLAVPALVGGPAPSRAAAAPAPRVSDGPCPGALAVAPPSGPVTCTHGPDPAPPGVDVGTSRGPAPAGRGAGPVGPPPLAPLCTGDGSGGPRVQLVYARPEGAPDRYDAYAASFQVWAAEVDAAVRDSAAQTGGVRRVRFVHDAACTPTVRRLVLSPATAGDWGTFVTEVGASDGNRTDRRYLVWMDANAFCGVAAFQSDDRPAQQNANNVGVSLVARVDSGCWGIPGASAEAHELMHTLGAVQSSAPHTTGRAHCSDEVDRMCGDDGSGVALTTPCPTGHENLFDCNHDDYFSTAPVPGSYLATHWNAADSRYLAGPPGRPGPVQAIAGEGLATVSWTAPPDGNLPLTGYGLTTFADGTPTGPPTALPADTTTRTLTGLADGTSYTFAVAALNGLGAGDLSAPSEPVTPSAGSRYHPVLPARLLDTRSGNGGPAGRVPSTASIDLQVTGRGGVPTTGVSAAVLNLTVSEPLAGGYLTAWPTGGPRPATSNLNVAAGRTVANLAVVKLGDGGRLSLFNAAGAAHLLADVAGWYGADGETGGAGYHPVTPTRILDTRTGNSVTVGKVPPGAVEVVPVAGRGELPWSGVSAVALTVTAVEPQYGGYLTAWPTDDPRPVASNLNFDAGRTVANMVVVKVGARGQISLYNGGGPVHLVADVAGWYGDGADGARYHPVVSARVLDSRTGNGVAAGAVGYKATVDAAVQGRSGVPGSGVSSVVTNVTVVDALAGGYLTAWPAGRPRPLASSLNFGDRSTVAGLVSVQPGAGGGVSLYLSGGTAHLLADVAGWFGPPA